MCPARLDVYVMWSTSPSFHVYFAGEAMRTRSSQDGWGGKSLEVPRPGKEKRTKQSLLSALVLLRQHSLCDRFRRMRTTCAVHRNRSEFHALSRKRCCCADVSVVYGLEVKDDAG